LLCRVEAERNIQITSLDSSCSDPSVLNHVVIYASLWKDYVGNFQYVHSL